jgi:hypothetical protein
MVHGLPRYTVGVLKTWFNTLNQANKAAAERPWGIQLNKCPAVELFAAVFCGKFEMKNPPRVV